LPVLDVDSEGTKKWRNAKNELHRLDGPAVKYLNGDQEWWVNGELHRDDGPAVVNPYGVSEWRCKGKLHRVGGPATEWADGTKEWYENDEVHRVGGPAKEWEDGTREWYQNNVRHRLDGPAYVDVDGNEEWWVNGGFTSEATVRLLAAGAEVASYQPEKWVKFVFDMKLRRVKLAQYYLKKDVSQLTEDDHGTVLEELFADGVFIGALSLPSPYVAGDFGLGLSDDSHGVVFLKTNANLKETFEYRLPDSITRYDVPMDTADVANVFFYIAEAVNSVVLQDSK
jgi:hypothetical protein